MKRCLEAGCLQMATPGYSRCLPHERRTYHVYNDPAYRRWARAKGCEWCGAITDLTRDHITPVSKGGTNQADNLRTLCRSCNSSRKDGQTDA